MSDVLFNKILSFRGRQTPIRLGDYPILGANSSKIFDAIVLWGTTLFDLADIPVTDVTRSSQLLQWLDYVSRCDLLVLEQDCKRTLNLLHKGELRELNDLIIDFKGRWSQSSMTAGHFLVPLSWIDWEPSGITPFNYLFLNTLLSFPFKVNVSLPLEGILEEEYIELEHEMQSWSFDDHLVSSLNRIASSWLGEFSPTLIPRHGPGGVANTGRTPSYEKTMTLIPDLRLQYVLKKYNEIFLIPESSAHWERCSDVVFVPKSIKTYRTICMEPAILQYVQQGVSRSLSDYFVDKRFHPIRLSDQNRSVRWARKGSLDQSLATIDLSSASDTIHIDLVKGVFKGTAVYPLLIASRSENASLPSGKKIPLKKFAPMGSACCFPIESFLFAAICEHCARSLGLPVNSKKYIVYGDDIIVPDYLAPLVIETLQRLHFKVNTEKSFYGKDSHFRESCGGEFYRGFDVTPLRLPRNFPGLNVVGITDSSTLIALANSCFDRSMKLTRRIILKSLLSSRVLIPFSNSGEIGIKTDNPTNFHLPRMRNLSKGYGSDIGVIHHALSTKTTGSSKREISTDLHGFVQRGFYDDYKRWHDWHRYAFTFPHREEAYASPQGRPIMVLKKVITPLSRLKE